MQLVLKVEWLCASDLRRGHLDANDKTVMLQDLKVVPHAVGKVSSIYVNSEATVSTSFKLYGTDAHAVPVIVEGIECLCTTGNGADERVEGYGVLRESKPKVRVVRETLVVGTSHNQQSKQQSKERPPNPL